MITFFVAAMAILAMGEEWLAMPMPDGFVTVHKQQNWQGSIEERVPKGETVDRWTRMITLIKLRNMADPAAYATDFERRVLTACPGAKAWPRTPTVIDSQNGIRQGYQGIVSCPLNPQTGLPETFLYRVAGTGSPLYMVQVAFRRGPQASDRTWAEEQMGNVTICTDTSYAPCAR